MKTHEKYIQITSYLGIIMILKEVSGLGTAMGVLLIGLAMTYLFDRFEK